MKINWVHDLRFEKRCKELGVTWEYREDTKVSEVDVKGSLLNNARLYERLNQDNVLSCSIDMEAGMPIHAIALRKRPNKLLMDVIGGNHRLKSLDTLNINVFTCYVVKCTDEQYDNLTRVDNRGGMGQNKEEAIQHCVYQHTQYGTPLTILAKKWAVDPQKLQRVVRNQELQKYLEDNHIPCENLSVTVIDALNPLKDQKAVLERAAHICHMYLPSSTVVDTMVATIQKKNTERQKLDYLETWEKHLKSSAPPPGKKKPRSPLKTKLFNLMDTETGLLKLLNQGGKSADGNKSITNINQLDFEPVDADRLISLNKLIQDCLKPLLTQSQDMLRQIDPTKKKRR